MASNNTISQIHLPPCNQYLSLMVESNLHDNARKTRSSLHLVSGSVPVRFSLAFVKSNDHRIIVQGQRKKEIILLELSLLHE